MTGLQAHACLHNEPYPNKFEITDQQLAAANLHRHTFHGESNYTITPSPN